MVGARGLFLGALCAVAAVGMAAPVLAKTYTNALFGIAIERPDKWRTISVAEAISNVRSVAADSPEIEAHIAHYERAALFVFMKHSMSHPGINPTVKVSVRSTAGIEQASDTDILNAMVPELAAALRGFAVVEAPARMRVGNADGARLTVTFQLSFNGEIRPVRARMWLVKRDRYFVTVTASGPADDDFKELDAIANSLVLTK